MALESSSPKSADDATAFPQLDGPALASLPEDENEEEHLERNDEWIQNVEDEEVGVDPSAEGLEADDSALFLEQLKEKELLRESYSLAGKKEPMRKSPKRRAKAISPAASGSTTGSVLSENPSLREPLRSSEPLFLGAEQKASAKKRPVHAAVKPRKTLNTSTVTSSEGVLERPSTALHTRAPKSRSKLNDSGIRDKETVRRSLKVVVPSGRKTSNSGDMVPRRRVTSPQSVEEIARRVVSRTKTGSTLPVQRPRPVSVSVPSESQHEDEDSEDRLGDLSLDSNNDGGFMSALKAIQGQELGVGKTVTAWEASQPSSKADTLPLPSRKRVSSKPSVPRARISKKK